MERPEAGWTAGLGDPRRERACSLNGPGRGGKLGRWVGLGLVGLGFLSLFFFKLNENLIKFKSKLNSNPKHSNK